MMGHCAALIAAKTSEMLEMRKTNELITRGNLCTLNIDKVDSV